MEEQFYLLWPALVMAMLGRSRTAPARLTIALGALTAGGFAAMWALASTGPVWAFYAMPARAWEFAVGALAVVTRVPGISGRAWAGWAGVALIALSATCVSPGRARGRWLRCLAPGW